MKTAEEIRKELSGMNQTEFANSLGMSLRTYCTRITEGGWSVRDIVAASSWSDGQIRVTVDGVDYDITIREC
ncbi:MAG: hypothetical protein IKD59_05440 [Lachnospiraceae bacterium]|nr:hypothetical protein [Lachnospiraceae bacterium]